MVCNYETFLDAVADIYMKKLNPITLDLRLYSGRVCQSVFKIILRFSLSTIMTQSALRSRCKFHLEIMLRDRARNKYF